MTETKGKYDQHLDKRPANYTPLTPLSFLARSAVVYPNKTAVIHGDIRFSYQTFYARCRRLASALKKRGIGTGDTVAVMAPNNPPLLEAAVVARPDEKWGETPCAFVTLKPDAVASDADIIDFCLANMAHFKAPKSVVFGELPKTSTGKIQKVVLREKAKEL